MGLRKQERRGKREGGYGGSREQKGEREGECGSRRSGTRDRSMIVKMR
jgi:hypothetical protein